MHSSKYTKINQNITFSFLFLQKKKYYYLSNHTLKYNIFSRAMNKSQGQAT